MFMALMDVLAWLFVIGLGILVLMFALAGLGALIGNMAVGIREVLKRLRAYYREMGWHAWVLTAIIACFVLLPFLNR